MRQRSARKTAAVPAALAARASAPMSARSVTSIALKSLAESTFVTKLAPLGEMRAQTIKKVPAGPELSGCENFSHRTRI